MLTVPLLQALNKKAGFWAAQAPGAAFTPAEETTPKQPPSKPLAHPAPSSPAGKRRSDGGDWSRRAPDGGTHLCSPRGARLLLLTILWDGGSSGPPRALPATGIHWAWDSHLLGIQEARKSSQGGFVSTADPQRETGQNATKSPATTHPHASWRPRWHQGICPGPEPVSPAVPPRGRTFLPGHSPSLGTSRRGSGFALQIWAIRLQGDEHTWLQGALGTRPCRAGR